MRRRLLPGLGVLAAVLCVAAAFWGCSGSGSDSVDREAITFTRFDGTPASLAEYDGQPMVINFFASWCAPCVTEMPALEEVHQELGSSVTFLGLAVNDTVADAQALVDRTGVTWDLGRDTKGAIVEALGGVGMPTTVLVSADGEIVARHTGELSTGELRQLIDDKLLA